MKRKCLIAVFISVFIACIMCAFAACFSGVHTVKYVAGDGGYIEGESVQKVADGENGTMVVAVPYSGYAFSGWSDGVLTAERTDISVSKDISVRANFEKLGSVSITYFADEGGYIQGEAEQWGEPGESATPVTAVADNGYLFDGWSDGVLTAERTDTYADDCSLNFTARFKRVDTEQFAGGIGSEAYPYLIETKEQLENVKLYPNSNFRLMKDITLPAVEEGQTNLQLLDDGVYFNGVFDGNGHAISGLTISGSDGAYTGLFGNLAGEVRGLKLENVNISGFGYVGGIAGYSLGVITDCFVSGSVTLLSDADAKFACAGGVVGYIDNSPQNSGEVFCVSEVSAKIQVYVQQIGEGFNLGGLFGYVSDSLTVKNCSAEGSIVFGGENIVYNGSAAGGIVGCCGEGVVLSGCNSAVNITDGYIVGGLAGAAGGDASIADCYATGNVYGSGFSGGLIGVGGNGVSVENCYSSGDVVSEFSCGGLIGGLGSDGALKNCYASGTVTCVGCISYDPDVSMDVCVGGLAGYIDKNTGIDRCYAMGDVTASNDADICVGGLVGKAEGGNSISESYAAGNVAAKPALRKQISYVLDVNLFVGGLVGRMCYWDNVIINCFSSGSLSAEEGDYADNFNAVLVGGGLIGETVYADISYSYTVSRFAEGVVADKKVIGGVVGSAYDLSIANVHWYAVQLYEPDLGYWHYSGWADITLGAQSHMDLSEFYTLASVLNKGQGASVWGNVGENSYPSLIRLAL